MLDNELWKLIVSNVQCLAALELCTRTLVAASSRLIVAFLYFLSDIDAFLLNNSRITGTCLALFSINS